jgi:hypothetical protein
LGVFHFGFLLLGKIVDWLFSFALSLGMNMLVSVFSLMVCWTVLLRERFNYCLLEPIL